MKRFLWMWVAVLSLGVFPVQGEVVELVREGMVRHRIVVAADAIASERHAAAELARFLQEVTGGDFPVVAEAEAGDGPCIWVGLGEGARRLLPGGEPGSLGGEEYVMETHPPHLVLAGGRPRGTLYAVYAFLEDVVGCRWYAPAVQRIPKRPDLAVGPLAVRSKPAFEYREPFAFCSYDGDWSARNRCNGHASRLEARHGGKISYQGFVHTFFSLVPPEKFFVAHPEYYAEIGGKRTAEHSQLCLTAPGFVDEVVANVMAMLKDAPEGAIISVSQNDWHGWCTCAACEAATREEGSVSGPLIRFVNQVAERVGKVRPDVAIDTLAYQQSRKPPLHVRPLPNVIVRLCSIECSFARPLTSEANRAFAEDIRGWSRICQRLYVWDYVTNFAHYVQPHPNLRVLQPNLAFFAMHGVKGVFEQGGYQSPGGEFQELRSWVLAKLLWDPQADAQRLIDEFLTGYYGSAGPFIRRYIDQMHDAVEREGDFLNCYSPVTAAFLNPVTVGEADRLWEAAEQAAVAVGDEGLLQRVRVGRLPVQYVMMRRERAWSRDVTPWEPVLRGSALRQRFFAVAERAGITHISEPGSMEGFRADWLMPERRPAAPPEGVALPAGGSWYDYQDDEFQLARPGVWAAVRPDPLASDGAAARLDGDHREWAVQLSLDLPELKRQPGKPWRIAIAIRAEKSANAGVAFSCGLYDHAARREVTSRVVQAGDIHGDGYVVYELGKFPVGPRSTVWVAPAGSTAAPVGAVWVDRIVLSE